MRWITFGSKLDARLWKICGGDNGEGEKDVKLEGFYACMKFKFTNFDLYHNFEIKLSELIQERI